MSIRESLQDDLVDLDALQSVASALADQSMKQIRRVRATFERSVPFHQSVHDLYALIRLRAAREGVPVHAFSRGSGMAVVALTSNHRFCGELNLAVVRALTEQEPPSGEARTMVIGRTGTLYMKELGYARRTHSLRFAEDMPSMSELSAFLFRLAGYERVVLYYPAFINLLTQRVEKVEIGASLPHGIHKEGRDTHALALSGRGEGTTLTSSGAYIFEPELAELVLFFETEVRRFLFQRIFLEAELARSAARLLVMSTAERTIETRTRAVRGALRRVRGAVETMRMIETFGSILEWRKIQERDEMTARAGAMR